MGREKIEPFHADCIAHGSPPRGRGKGHGCHQTAVVVGITPAWAGKNWPTASTTSTGWDHPRMGGEKFVDESHFYKNLGSPPRGRGKVGHNQIAGAAHGITPAWTGKRVHEYKSGRFARDHPRMGGEKQTITRIRDANEGSPPHGRGKVCHVIYCLV